MPKKKVPTWVFFYFNWDQTSALYHSLKNLIFWYFFFKSLKSVFCLTHLQNSPNSKKWYSRNSITDGNTSDIISKILLGGFYLILGMAWLNQVELTLIIQSAVSVWTDKRAYRCSICCWIEDRQLLCLPKRQNRGCGYGGYVNTSARPRWRAGLAIQPPHHSHSQMPSMWDKEQHVRQ